MDLMDLRRRLLMMGGSVVKVITIITQNTCTIGNELNAEIRAVIPTDDFVAWNDTPVDTLELTENSVVGICNLNFNTGGVRPICHLLLWAANYWHPENNMGSTIINVPAGSVFKAYVLDYK